MATTTRAAAWTLRLRRGGARTSRYVCGRRFITARHVFNKKCNRGGRSRSGGNSSRSSSSASRRKGGLGDDFRLFGRTSMAVIQFASVLYVIDTYVFEFTACYGPSMYPTLNEVGDLLLIEHITYRFLRKPRVGDVVLCRSPKNPTVRHRAIRPFGYPTRR